MKIKHFIIFYIIIGAIGVLFHFVYDLLNIPILKVFFPSNESVFEHLKLILFPVIIFMFLDKLLLKEQTFKVNVFGIIIAMCTIIVLYYTYTGIIGKNFGFIDILIYFIALFIFFYIRYKKITPFETTNSVIAFIIILIFIEVFTFYPLNIPFFIPN